VVVLLLGKNLHLSESDYYLKPIQHHQSPLNPFGLLCLFDLVMVELNFPGIQWGKENSKHLTNTLAA